MIRDLNTQLQKSNYVLKEWAHWQNFSRTMSTMSTFVDQKLNFPWKTSFSLFLVRGSIQNMEFILSSRLSHGHGPRPNQLMYLLQLLGQGWTLEQASLCGMTVQESLLEQLTRERSHSARCSRQWASQESLESPVEPAWEWRWHREEQN